MIGYCPNIASAVDDPTPILGPFDIDTDCRDGPHGGICAWGIVCNGGIEA